MALHRTSVAPAPRPGARLLALGAAAALIVLTGCDTLSYRRLDFDNTEAAKIEKIRLLPGSGDVVVRTGSAPGVRIKRVVRYHGAQPDAMYRIEGTELVLDTDCGNGCSVSFEVTAPATVTVRGETGSGDVDLSGVGPVEVKLGSGDARVTGSTGPVRVETGSGNIEVDDVAGAVTLRASSGNVTGRRLGGRVDAEANSGDVDLELSAPASARARADSGSVQLVVPEGRYRVRSATGNGEAQIDVPDQPDAPLLLDVSTGSGDISVSRR